MHRKLPLKQGKRSFLESFAFIVAFSGAFAQNRPNLFLSTKDVQQMKTAIGKYPMFDQSFQAAVARVDEALSRAIDVPVPADAGGNTHERHKQNYTEMQLAGVLFAVTRDEKYARFVRDMLLKYSELYPTLRKHPNATGESYGRLFWQTLNETVWLVHATQAYDCVYEFLSPSERKKIEDNVFRPMAKFFSEEHKGEMDRIHNHGTWTCAAVGMAGYVMNDRDLVEKALQGSKKDGKGGFLAQLQLLFSPDGFYTEGPYYVRYALLPFFTFAQVIANNDPSLKIFEFRNQILAKAFESAMQLTYTNGAFIPFNDALKEKTYLSPEIPVALNITFARYGENRSYLPIARRQNTVILSGAGAVVAKVLLEDANIGEFPYRSVEYTDGANGDKGGVGILRYGNVHDQSLVLMKYTGHGLSHGHYDKLAIIYYDQGGEILQDYGAARFINVEPKYGGRYLPETKSFAMQTIAHNTLTVDGKSHYEGKQSVSERFHADRHFFTVSDSNLQVMSAKATTAYPGVAMQRTVALVNDAKFGKPIVIDVFRIESRDEHVYDLPFYYVGHLISTNTKYTANTKQMGALGTTNGYQHLWKEAEGRADGSVQFSWIAGERYYSVTSAADTSVKVFFLRIGAGDPNFNLRHEPAVMLRTKARSYIFASVLEPHGQWDGTKEFSVNASSSISSVRILASSAQASVVQIEGKDILWKFFIANEDHPEAREHWVDIAGFRHSWRGPVSLVR